MDDRLYRSKIVSVHACHMRRAPVGKVNGRAHRPPSAPHRSRRLALDPFLVEETTFTRDELLRARAADPFWPRITAHIH
jgi:hypothetical protein